MADIVMPIWQDVDIRINTGGETLPYIIRTNPDKKTIFSGVAYPAPNNTSVVIRPNEVCADHLKQTLPAIDFDTPMSTWYSAPIAKEFEIVRTDTNAVAKSVLFVLDWSYEPNVSVEDFRNVPIDTKVSPSMVILATQVNPETLTAHILNASKAKLGEEEIVIEERVSAATFFLWLGSVKSNYPTAQYVEVGGITYELSDDCAPYALLYVNAQGGWDVLRMVSGVQSQRLTRSTFKQRYKNDIREARGTVNYQNEITPTWLLTTDWLTDEGAGRMPNLVGSTMVYLHNLRERTIHPVIITDTSVEIKTFRNQGRQLVRYDINVELAQDRLRR